MAPRGSDSGGNHPGIITRQIVPQGDCVVLITGGLVWQPRAGQGRVSSWRYLHCGCGKNTGSAMDQISDFFTFPGNVFIQCYS